MTGKEDLQLRSFWRMIFLRVDQAPISASEKERLKHYTVFVVIGVPAMVAFAVYNLMEANYFLSGMIAVTAIGLVVSWMLLNRLKSGQVIYRITCLLYVMLLVYMLAMGGPGGSKILWMYTFPLITFFLLGRKEGLFWACGIFTVAAILLFVPLPWIDVYNYHPQFRFRLVASFFIVTTITYWLQAFRDRYQTKLKQEHRQLVFEKRRLRIEIVERKIIQQEKETLIQELKATLEKVNTLRGLIPICANCKSIRDDKGYWNRLEGYIQKHSDAEFSHGICPDCREKLYPGLYPNGEQNK